MVDVRDRPARRETPRRPRRLWRRFVVFGIAVVIVVAGLGIRLFQLQVDRRPIATRASRSSSARAPSAVPVTRGLIYDRKGRQLVENVPIFVVRIAPWRDPVPHARRGRRTGSRSCWTCRPAEIYEAIDGIVGSPFDPVTIAERGAHAGRARHRRGAPGPARRDGRRRSPGATTCTGRSWRTSLGWTGHISADEYQRAARRRLPGRTTPSASGRGGHVRARAARPVRRPGGPAGRRRPGRQRAADAPGAGGGRLARADHRPRHPARGREGAQVGHEARPASSAACSSS